MWILSLLRDTLPALADSREVERRTLDAAVRQADAAWAGFWVQLATAVAAFLATGFAAYAASANRKQAAAAQAQLDLALAESRSAAEARTSESAQAALELLGVLERWQALFTTDPLQGSARDKAGRIFRQLLRHGTADEMTVTGFQAQYLPIVRAVRESDVYLWFTAFTGSLQALESVLVAAAPAQEMPAPQADEVASFLNSTIVCFSELRSAVQQASHEHVVAPLKQS